MTEEIPAQGRYGGGQACAGCDAVVGIADRYCRWCGTALRGEPPTPLTGDDVHSGDTVFVVVATSTERFTLPAAHPDRNSWAVTGRVYGDTRIRISDRRDELRLEWDREREAWGVLGSLRRAHLFGDVQDDCSPGEWPDDGCRLPDVEAWARARNEGGASA